MSLIHERTREVRKTLDRIAEKGFPLKDPSAEQVDNARRAFLDLARQTHLFPEAQFPYLYSHRSGFYRLSEDADRGRALYLQVSTTHAANSPHEHPYWAVITGVKGNEINYLYQRLDKGEEPGRGKLTSKGAVPIKEDVSLFIPKETYHTIEAEPGEVAVHLHFYGIGVDTPQHRGVTRFKTPESEEIVSTPLDIEPGRIGVQRVSLEDVSQAVAGGKPVVLLTVDDADGLPQIFSKAPRVRHDAVERSTADLPADVQIPIILAGEGTAARLAAERLTRLGYAHTFWFDPQHG